MPRDLPAEVERLAEIKGITDVKADPGQELKAKEKLLKSPTSDSRKLNYLYLGLGLCVIFAGWIMFGLGVGWGVHGSVIAGTTGE